jgi:hypothetical protein
VLRWGFVRCLVRWRVVCSRCLERCFIVDEAGWRKEVRILRYSNKSHDLMCAARRLRQEPLIEPSTPTDSLSCRTRVPVHLPPISTSHHRGRGRSRGHLIKFVPCEMRVLWLPLCSVVSQSSLRTRLIRRSVCDVLQGRKAVSEPYTRFG